MCIRKYVFTLLKDIRYKLNEWPGHLVPTGISDGSQTKGSFPTPEPSVTSTGSRQVRVRLSTKTTLDNTTYLGHTKGWFAQDKIPSSPSLFCQWNKLTSLFYKPQSTSESRAGFVAGYQELALTHWEWRAFWLDAHIHTTWFYLARWRHFLRSWQVNSKSYPYGHVH